MGEVEEARSKISILDCDDVTTWVAAARATAALVAAHTPATLAAYVRDLQEFPEALALLDRNDLESPCERRVYLKPLPGVNAERLLTLSDQEDIIQDEPDDGCPRAGFS
jgi:hypothetical protein